MHLTSPVHKRIFRNNYQNPCNDVKQAFKLRDIHHPEDNTAFLAKFSNLKLSRQT